MTLWITDGTFWGRLKCINRHSCPLYFATHNCQRLTSPDLPWRRAADWRTARPLVIIKELTLMKDKKNRRISYFLFIFFYQSLITSLPVTYICTFKLSVGRWRFFFNPAFMEKRKKVCYLNFPSDSFQFSLCVCECVSVLVGVVLARCCVALGYVASESYIHFSVSLLCLLFHQCIPKVLRSILEILTPSLQYSTISISKTKEWDLSKHPQEGKIPEGKDLSVSSQCNAWIWLQRGKLVYEIYVNIDKKEKYQKE